MLKGTEKRGKLRSESLEVKWQKNIKARDKAAISDMAFLTKEEMKAKLYN
jgi:hypothetical protein